MTDRPILMSGAMVRATLRDENPKTQTRRILKQAVGPSLSVGMEDVGVAELSWLHGAGPGHDVDESTQRVNCPYGVPGDRLWVREAWRTTGDGGRADDMPPRDLQPHTVWYEANGAAPVDECVGKCRPGIFMPRWASRITLELTDVRVERLQDISEEDAIAEGIERHYDGWMPYTTAFYEADGRTPANYLRDPRESFRQLWESINAERGFGWDANPWVWVVEFGRIGCNT